MGLAAAAILVSPSHSSVQSDLPPAPLAPPAAGKIVVYRQAILIDGMGGPLRPNMAVVVNGSTIEQVMADARPSPDLLRKRQSSI